MCPDSFDTGQTIPDITKLYRSRVTMCPSTSSVLVAPNLSGYKQSHLAAAPLTLFLHQPPSSSSYNLRQLSRGRSMWAKTWQELSMPPLSSDQRGFNQSEQNIGLIHTEAKDGEGQPTASFVSNTWIFISSCTLVLGHKHCRKLYQIP